MRVALTMLTFASGEMGGSERYARELARALVAAGTDATAVLPAPAAAFETLQVQQVETGGRARSRALRMLRLAARSRRHRGSLAGYDVVHYPFTVPLPPSPVSWVTTLHDLQHHDLPQLFRRAERVYRSAAYDRAASRADAVVVISEFVRARAIDVLGLDPARVHAIPLGVDHARFSPGQGHREPYLLYPARGWPHKNHRRLFEAFTLLRREHPELRLVLTGGGLSRLDPPPGVVVRGQVSDDELVSLYRRAACLVFPSLYEGFGLPPLEAMACGCPVAASRAAAIPEVCADAAVLFDPRDPEAIAAGVGEALARGSELAAAGLERAQGFTWAATAAAHAAVYRSLSTRS